MKYMPMRTVEEIYKKAKRNERTYVKQGCTYTAMYSKGKFELIHYGAVIFGSDENTKVYYIGYKAYSATDRDAINSMMRILDINQKYQMRKGEMLPLGPVEHSGWSVVKEGEI